MSFKSSQLCTLDVVRPHHIQPCHVFSNMQSGKDSQALSCLAGLQLACWYSPHDVMPGHASSGAALVASISARRVRHAFFMELFKHVLQWPHRCDALIISYVCFLFLGA